MVNIYKGQRSKVIKNTFTSYFLSITFIHLLFINTVFSQKKDNTVSLYFGPSISSSITLFNATYNKNYFYSWSPYLNFSAEIIYRQKMSRQSSLNAGFGLMPESFTFYHNNYYLAYNEELMYKQITCVNYKVPLYFEYEFELSQLQCNISTTIGGEINLIHAYGESSGGTSGFGTDSTSFAVYEKNNLNASVRAGVEFSEILANDRIKFYITSTYHLIPFGDIYIINPNNDLGANFLFEGEASPSQISINIGIIIVLFIIK